MIFQKFESFVYGLSPDLQLREWERDFRFRWERSEFRQDFRRRQSGAKVRLKHNKTNCFKYVN